MKASQLSNSENRPGDGLEPLLNEHDVARLTHMSVAAVRRWRLRNSGPPYIKLNFSVRYDLRELRAWLASRPMGGERVVGVGNE